MSGGWKVAYADFMTAMMAFFLLMWLLSITDEKTKAGLASYFTPKASLETDNVSPVGMANNPLIHYVDKLDTREFKMDEIEMSHYAIARALKEFLLQGRHAISFKWHNV